MANKNGFFKLELLLLSVLSHQDCYGYQLTSMIKKMTNNHIVIKDGTLYPILFKLLDQGCISTYDIPVGKKIRVYYHIEPSGLEKLEEMILEFNQTVEYIRKVIDYKGDDSNEQ